jgi:predicted nucleotidyltransferase
MEIYKDWIELVSILLDHGVRFLIIGGHAVSAHGYPRSTEDLDLFIEMSADNADRILASLNVFFGADLGFERETFVLPDKVQMIGEVPYRVDILTTIAGVQFEEAYSRRRTLPFGSVSAPYIGIDELIKNKKAAGRPKDLGDAGELERLK